MTDNRKERRREMQMRFEQRVERSGHSNIWTGLFILLIGVAALVKVSNPELPDYLFSWKTFLIALGLFIGVKHQFRGFAWFLLILVGAASLLNDIYPDIAIRRYIWPMVLILVGAFLIFRPRHRHRWKGADGEKKNSEDASSSDTVFGDKTYDYKEDFVDSTSIFGGAKKNIISKNFKGGDLINIFGGTELDLTRADFNGTATIELTTIFGGTKLIVPSHWTIKSEAVTLFGGMEDKRNIQTMQDSQEKVLLLKGTVIFGGIEIKSF